MKLIDRNKFVMVLALTAATIPSFSAQAKESKDSIDGEVSAGPAVIHSQSGDKGSTQAATNLSFDIGLSPTKTDAKEFSYLGGNFTINQEGIRKAIFSWAKLGFDNWNLEGIQVRHSDLATFVTVGAAGPTIRFNEETDKEGHVSIRAGLFSAVYDRMNLNEPKSKRQVGGSPNISLDYEQKLGEMCKLLLSAYAALMFSDDDGRIKHDVVYSGSADGLKETMKQMDSTSTVQQSTSKQVAEMTETVTRPGKEVTINALAPNRTRTGYNLAADLAVECKVAKAPNGNDIVVTPYVSHEFQKAEVRDYTHLSAQKIGEREESGSVTSIGARVGFQF